MELRPKTILETLNALNAFHRPEFLERFLLCCEADFLGRGENRIRPYPQAQLMRKYFKAAQNIDTEALAKSGLSGKDYGEKLARFRLQAIKAVKTGMQ